MLDTDVASYLIRDPSPERIHQLGEASPHSFVISAVTRGELRYGLGRRPEAVTLARVTELFLAGVETLPWDDAAADRCGVVRAELALKGRPIGSLDEMIAAHALSCDAVLVTGNVRHFGRVTGLRLRAWERSA